MGFEPTTFGAQLAEHWASIPKVVGSNPTVARHIFQACPVWIYTQSNITQARNIYILENRGKSYKKLNTVGSIQFLKKWKIHDLDAYFWAIMQEKSFF